MAVEASEGGGAGVAGELLTRSELEVKKEKEMGEEFEHIACRDGDDYDSNETEGSFVMVMSSANSDGRSNSSEREIELDAGGGVGDPQDACGAQPSAINWGSSTFVDDKRNDEGSEEKGEEASGGGDQVQVAEVMPVVREEDVADSIRTDHELKEEETDDSKDEMTTVIQDLNEEDKVVDVEVSKNEDQNQVEDSKDKKEEVTEGSNNEEEAAIGVEERVSGGMEASYVQNEAEIICKGQHIRAASSPIASSDPVNGEHGWGSMLKENEDVESSVTHPGKVDTVSKIEKSGYVESPVLGKKEVDSASEIEEKRDVNDEIGKDVAPLVTEFEMEEVNSVSDFEDKREVDDEESKVNKKDGRQEVESSMTNHVKEAVGSVSLDGVKNNAKDNMIKCGDRENERKSSIQADENQQSKASPTDCDTVDRDLRSPVEQVQHQNINASLSNSASEEKYHDSSIDLIAEHVKKNIVLSSTFEDQVAKTSSIGQSPECVNKDVNLASRAEDKHVEALSIDNQQSNTSPIEFDSANRDFRPSVEQVQQQDIDTSLSKSDSEEKDQESPIKLIPDPFRESIGSSSIIEEYQVAEASSIGQSPESVNECVNLASRAEDKHFESLSIENQQCKASPTDSDCVDIELKSSVDQVQQQDVDISLSKSVSEEKVQDSSIELIAEPNKENIDSSSAVEEYQVAEASSIGQCPEEDVNVASRAEDKYVEVLSIESKQTKVSPTHSDSVDRDLRPSVEQEQQQDVDASPSKSVNEEKDQESSIELIPEPVRENIGSSSIVEEYQVAEASFIGPSLEHVNEDANLASRAEDKHFEALSIENQQCKASPTDSDCVDIELRSSVEQVQQQDVYISLSKSVSEEKVQDSSMELIAEPNKENIDSSSTVQEYQVAEASSIGQSQEEDVNVASRTEKHVEALSIENQQNEGSPTDSDSGDRDLRPSVKQVQQHVNASPSKSDSEKKGRESSNKLIPESVRENFGSSSIVGEYQVAEASFIGLSLESINEDINFASREEDKCVEALSIEANLVPFEKLGSDNEAEENQNDEASSSHFNPEPKEDICFAKVEEKQDVDASFNDSNPEPIQMHMGSTSRVEESHDANASCLYLCPESITEVVGSASKTEENHNAEALVTKGDNERTKLQSVTELAYLETRPFEDPEGTKDRKNDLKLVEQQDFDDIVVETGNEKSALKSATEIEEPLEIHLDKDLGEIKEKQKELKSEEKQAAEHIKPHQGSAAPSPSDGDGEKGEKHAKKHYIIKVPRFTRRVIDNELQQKIHEAQMKVDENTRNRDSIMAELENTRKVLSDLCHKRDSVIEEEKKAKILVNAKRQEMDSLQSVISKGNIAVSFLDIASQIHTLEQKIHHETISLKEEKKYLHELNQLKHEREQHLFSKCSQPEIDEALRQKETAESSLRALKKEFDLLRSAHLKANESAKAASKSYIDQFNKVKEHEKKWKTANELRQNAYKDFHGLKSEKLENFWKYMDDRQAAKKYASSRDIDGLERHCTEQVERILQLWNKDDYFRRQYVESNVNSALRKFGTLDGRTAGLNEKLVAFPSRVPQPSSTRILTAPVTVQEEQPLRAQEISKPAQQIKQMVRSKQSSKSTLIEGAPSIVSLGEEIVEAEVEKKLTEEEEEQVRLAEEQARKEEELRKERAAEELKVKIRIEQKVKAKEAEERKRRKAEKAQARADYKAQKVADLRLQKRENKEKKKDDMLETTGSMEGDPASVAETSHEKYQEPERNPRRTSKRSTRQSAAALSKYNSRIQPVPLPLRNKGKRKTSTWVLSLCGAAAVGGLLFAGNYISFSDISLLDFGF